VGRTNSKYEVEDKCIQDFGRKIRRFLQAYEDHVKKRTGVFGLDLFSGEEGTSGNEPSGSIKFCVFIYWF